MIASSAHLFPEISEILQGPASDLHDFLHVDRIDAALAGPEGDRNKADLPVVIVPERRQHDIGEIIISRHFLNVFFDIISCHQSERCI